MRYCACALVLALCISSPALAKWEHSAAGHSRSGKNASGFAKKCKSKACFKKHPDGYYYIPAKKQK